MSEATLRTVVNAFREGIATFSLPEFVVLLQKAALVSRPRAQILLDGMSEVTAADLLEIAARRLGEKGE